MGAMRTAQELPCRRKDAGASGHGSNLGWRTILDSRLQFGYGQVAIWQEFQEKMANYFETLINKQKYINGFGPDNRFAWVAKNDPGHTIVSRLVINDQYEVAVLFEFG